MKFEIDREIIAQLELIADAGTVSFNKTPDPGISYTEHKLAFVDTLLEGSNKIFFATRRATANWIIAGEMASNIIESLPGFVPNPAAAGQMGVIKIGRLNGKWDIYKDPYMATAKFLIGYKGVSFLETGYIYAPYIPLYMTPTVILDDFLGRKGLGTSYAKKCVNGKLYCKGLVTT